MMTEKPDILDEEEVYDTDGCKVFVRRDGQIRLSCPEKVKEIFLGNIDLRIIHGISEMVLEMNEENDDIDEKD